MEQIPTLRHSEVSRAPAATVNGKESCCRREEKYAGTDCLHFISVKSKS